MITIAYGNFGALSQWTGVTPAPRLGASKTFSVHVPSQMGLEGEGLHGFEMFSGIAAGFFDVLGGFLADLAAHLGTFVDFLMEGVDLVLGGLADIVGEIPIIGPLLGKILLFGAAVIKFVLNIPGRIIQGVGNILTGIGEYINEAWGADAKDAEINAAKEDILSDAPGELKGPIKALLNATGVTGSNPSPVARRNPDNPDVAEVDRDAEEDVSKNMEDAITGTTTGEILTYGIPAVGAAIALAIVL